MLFGKNPIRSQLLLVFRVPFSDQLRYPWRQFPRYQPTTLDINGRIELTVNRVEVWPPMVIVEDAHNDSKESAQFRHVADGMALNEFDNSTRFRMVS